MLIGAPQTLQLRLLLKKVSVWLNWWDYQCQYFLHVFVYFLPILPVTQHLSTQSKIKHIYTGDLKYLESSDIDPWDNNVIADSPLNFKSCKQVGKDKNTHSEQNTSLSYIYSQEYVHTKNGPDDLIGAVEITVTFRDAAGF